MEYMIAKEDDFYEYSALSRLEAKVNAMIARGWVPQGGIQVYKIGGNYTAIQAMVRKGEK